MKVNEQVHLIRKEFYVTPEVKRFINVYLIVGKICYLVDSGVKGTQNLIEEYLKSINRKMTDIKGVFLTHSHPDHIGAAAEIKRQTDCKIYAPAEELPWIEDIQKQFDQRPIPNFFNLLPESVKVEQPVRNGEVIELEEGIRICALSTKGHSHGSMSYILNDEVVFTGDAIPVAKDLPIFIDYEETVKSLDKLQSIPAIRYYCPAWDEVYNKDEFNITVKNSKDMLSKLKKTVIEVEDELSECPESEKIKEVLKRADMLKFSGNPLVIKSIEACGSMGKIREEQRILKQEVE